MKLSLPTMRRKVGPELPPIWLKRFASASHSPTMSVPRPAGEPGAEAAVLGRHLEHRGGVVAHRFELAPVADQPRVAEQPFQRLVRHRPHPARVEP